MRIYGRIRDSHSDKTWRTGRARHNGWDGRESCIDYSLCVGVSEVKQYIPFMIFWLLENILPSASDISLITFVLLDQVTGLVWNSGPAMETHGSMSTLSNGTIL